MLRTVITAVASLVTFDEIVIPEKRVFREKRKKKKKTARVR